MKSAKRSNRHGSINPEKEAGKIQKYHADDNATPSPRALLSYAPKRKLDLQYSFPEIV